MGYKATGHKTPLKDRERAKAYADRHREQYRAASKRYYEAHKAEVAQYSKVRNEALKKAAISGYGGVCACCGETRLEFLVLDHINGGGSKHRRALKQSGTGNFYLWIKRENFPLGFRVLCHNCNFAIGKYHLCPHTRTG